VNRRVEPYRDRAASHGEHHGVNGRIAAVDPPSGRLLRDTVSTGTACRYDPDPGRPTTWVLTGPG
jgi:hypothetical protein